MKVWYMCLSACLIVTASILDVAAQGPCGRGRGQPPIAAPTDRKLPPERTIEEVTRALDREKLPPERTIEEVTRALADKEKLPPEQIVAKCIVEKVADENVPDDPLLIDAKKLQEPEGLKTLRRYLDRKLGQGTDEEKDEKLKHLLLQFSNELTPERQATMRNELKLGKPSSKKCAWIACSLRICCYQRGSRLIRAR